MRKLLLLFMVSFLMIGIGHAQSIAWGPTNPAGNANDLEVYNGTSTASYEFTSDGSFSNVTIQVDLGSGVGYVAGTTIASTSVGGTVTALSSEGDNPALFSVSNLSLGETVSLEFARKANCDARAHKLGGGTFMDICRVLSNGSEVSYSNNSASAYGAEYDVVYGNLVISNIAHTPSTSTSVGSTIERKYNITNGSFGGLLDRRQHSFRRIYSQ